MSDVSMKAPPPVVTGIIIPGDIVRKKDTYEEIKRTRREAYDQLELSGLKSKFCPSSETRKKISTPLKIVGGILAAGLAYFGLKRFIKI